MKKPVFYSELAYVVGLLLLALGTALTEFGGYGISVVVAPAYILYLKLSEIWPFFTFGMAEYILQGCILVLMMLILRKIRFVYFLSFVTAILYGFFLDLAMKLVYLLPLTDPWSRAGVYLLGVVVCFAAIAFLFATYFPPEAYEMFVKNISEKFHIPLHRFKTWYDLGSCLLSVVMALLLFGQLRGIGIGTIPCALVNGAGIHLFSKLYDKIWTFRDGLPLRARLTESEETL